ncbi:CPBP family intramembrane glutamic endopeptidase [Streptomyces sp. NPDC041003]|uniref:CPBP family intramembrane glutamic endopeptidase n=1 Tax=Streptomyces sp. NPDC041003 TaxID=3155730 RepID=UPI0033C5F2D8
MPDHKQIQAQVQGEGGAPRSGWAAQAGAFLAVAFLAAGVCGALQPATGIPPEVLQLTQLGPALAVAAVALLWPGRIRDRLAGTLPARGTGPAGHKGRTPARGGGPAGHEGRTPARGGGPAGHEGRTPARGGGLEDREARMPARGSGLARREAWIPAGRRAALLLTPALITALCAGGALLTSGSLPVTSPQALAHPLALLVTAQLLGACAEEIGWRCYLQPLLRTRFGPVTASVLVGTAWGLWHVPVLAQAPAYAAGFLAATIAMSVILGLALERVRSNRLLLAGGFHTLVNLGMLFVTDETSPATAPMVVFGAACLAAAIPWTVSARRAQAAPDRITAATAHGPR